MPADDRARLNLLRQLEAVLGTEEANTLMSHLPPVTWNEIATKGDLTTLGTSVRGEMHTLGTTLRTEMEMLGTTLRTEMKAMETSLRSDMQTMETSLRSDMQTMETSLRTEMQVGFATLRTEFVEASNRHIKWMVTFAAAWTSLLVAAVRVMP